jgi:hypothetical protein
MFSLVSRRVIVVMMDIWNGSHWKLWLSVVKVNLLNFYTI